jgi:short-subunit dehydrogenase
MKGEVALITGASSGIGAELAKLAAADGCDLVLVARGRAQMQTLADELTQRHGISVRVLPKDLSDARAPQEIFDELAAAGLDVEILINNAGFALYGSLRRNDNKALLDLMQVNMVALTELCRLFLPQMVERGHGRVLNVASLAAFQPGPLMAAYYASKAYVLSLSEAVANELRGTGVTLTALCPGLTRTRFALRAGLDLSGLSKVVGADAQSVARAGYRGMMRGKTIVLPGLLNRVVAFSTRIVPRRILTAIARALHERVA